MTSSTGDARAQSSCVMHETDSAVTEFLKTAIRGAREDELFSTGGGIQGTSAAAGTLFQMRTQGAAECRLAAMAGGRDQWRSMVEGRLQAARAQWSATQQAEVDYSQRLFKAASAAGVTVEEGTLV